jgi:hypothetical protein
MVYLRCGGGQFLPRLESRGLPCPISVNDGCEGSYSHLYTSNLSHRWQIEH